MEVFTQHKTYDYFIDGACRYNAQYGAIGAAIAVMKGRRGKTNSVWQKRLSLRHTPTDSQAKLTALILAFEMAIKEISEQGNLGGCIVNIFTDSRYAIGCMEEYLAIWNRDGWRTSLGGPVVNQDLVQTVEALQYQLGTMAKDFYFWIPREANREACWHRNEELNKMSDGIMRLSNTLVAGIMDVRLGYQ
jgi:ribonuclease HI